MEADNHSNTAAAGEGGGGGGGGGGSQTKGNRSGETELSAKNGDKTKKEEPDSTPASAEREKEDKQGISQKNSRKNEFQRDTETLLGRLHLKDKYQQKFSPADFLQVGLPVKQDSDTCEKDLALTFLQRLMMLDYGARYVSVKTEDSPDVINSNATPESESADTDESDSDDIFSNSEVTQQSQQTHVHPMDVQMAVFHCSDSFFKQNMITKLSQCQYALPLLVPDPDTMDIVCPLWTFRQIRKTWKISETKCDSNIVTMKSLPICKAKTHMVSFFRLGSVPLSKSQLMNALINDRHETFFHRDCPGSTRSRYLMDGVAEIAWYCPAGKPSDAFTDCTALCNLHGDALLIEKQRDILIEKSSVNVVLVPTLDKGDKSAALITALSKSPKPLIILVADNNCTAVQNKKKKGKYKMGLKDRSKSDVSEELRRVIRNILSGSSASFQLETMAEVSGMRVDEADEVCQKGKSAVKEMVKLLEGLDVSKIKDQFLKCQGELWHDWCSKNKEQYRLKGHVEIYKSAKQNELKQIREKQINVSQSELIKSFTESLSGLTDRKYFMKWTQIFIDAFSTDDLSSILQRYDEKWTEVLDLKKKKKPDKCHQSKLQKKQSELEEISAELQSTTFGLEHMFREMGQIYEAHTCLEKQPVEGQTDWSKYPELAAQLLISGHPMELMDGDAGHVPLTWISGLLDEVIKKLGDKRVFVLSVLGVQSSGKSTMLNAMFGLQFAVSAGRCTKGAYMQLVKVSEEMKETLSFDYILVVDTEGLRALELAGNSKLNHDNELATFVVGLGNMTLINIFGENPADMHDVLQIVVQAFMRMKQVKLSASCVFVHQNVTDIAAAEMTMDGKRRLQEKLDQMAQLAAKEEVCDFKCFSDVIAFDVQNDVKYFAQLWEGSPPMAPPNPGYSESIQDLKKFILSKASKSKGIPLSEFKSKIRDLWNALLNENFVFSFKNTHEIAVYRKLEVQYGNWTWTLRSKMLEIENELYNRIEKGKLGNVEQNDLQKEMNQTHEDIKKTMTTYFDDDKDKEMLVQWRGRFEKKIQEFQDEQVGEVKRKLDQVIQQQKARKNHDDKKTEFENSLLQKSKVLAQQLKEKAKDEKELKKQFDKVWSKWVSELTAGIKQVEDINLDRDQSRIIKEIGFEWNLVNQCKEKKKYDKMSQVGDYSHYIALIKDQGEKEKTLIEKGVDFLKENLKKVEYTFRRYFGHEEQQQIRSLIISVEKESLDAVKSKRVDTTGYNNVYLQDIAMAATEKVAIFQSEKEYTLKKEFTVDLLLFVFDKAGSLLSEAHKTFQRNCNVRTYVESKKDDYFKIFRSFCKGNSSAVVLGEMICEKLKSSAVVAVCNKTASGLADEMRANCPQFNGNRSNLEKHVLKSLAENDKFEGFITYIRNPKLQVETFIKEEVQKYIFKDNKDKAQNILKKKIEDIEKHGNQVLFDATEKVKQEGGDVDKWVEEFSSLLQGDLKFSISCKNFTEEETEKESGTKTEEETEEDRRQRDERRMKKLDVLKEEIEKGFKSIMEEMRSLPLEKLKDSRIQTDQELIKHLCDCCWEKCPFCGAVCTNTVNNHSPDKHSVTFHRPSGVEGWHCRGTDELVIDFCTTLVASSRKFYRSSNSDETFPYKEFQKAGGKYATWKITPDESKMTYWKWFVCRFQKDIQEHHKLKFHRSGEIPKDWRDYKVQDAIKSLDAM